MTDAADRPRQIWVLVSNLVPVAGVLFFGWSALPLMVYYWIENAVIGAFNVPKILISGLTKEAPFNIMALVFVPFFIFHFGLFCFVHGIFVFAIFTIADTIGGRGAPTVDSFDLLGRVTSILQSDNDLFWSVIVLVLMQLFFFLVFWLLRGAWRTANPLTQMFEPYGRIVVLHFTIMLAAIPVILLGQPMLAILVLALLKAGAELGLPQFNFVPRDSEENAQKLADAWRAQMERKKPGD